MQTKIDSPQNEHFIDYGVDGVNLLRYVYRPLTPAANVPKPYLHPLRTLGGEVVTIHSPHDHHWHTGVMMTLTDVNGVNFWGGPTYTADRGYVVLDNLGRVEHTGFEGFDLGDDQFALDETLEWKIGDGTVWLNEQRRIVISEINRAESYWALTFSMALHNVSGETLALGSPTTLGRPNAGYGSLFWRGPRDFTGGKVIAPEIHEDYMGVPLSWLAFGGTHDSTHAKSTLLFVDDPTNPRYPNKWFVRTTPYACVSFSFMFDEIYKLAADETLRLSYHIAIFDGEIDAETLADVAEKLHS